MSEEKKEDSQKKVHGAETAAAGPDKAESNWDYTERRTEERKKISLKKPFHAELHMGDEVRTYLYIVDVSHGGIKIITDLAIPEDRPFTIKLLLKEPVSFVVQTVWQKQIVGYMYSIGLKFVELSQEAKQMVGDIMNKFAIDLSKKVYQLNKMVNLQILEKDKWKTFYAYIMEMSPEGLQYTTDFILPLDDEFVLRAFVIQGESPIEVRGKVLSETELPTGRSRGWIAFTEISREARLRLSEHIVKLLQGEPPNKIMATISDFQLDE